ncbi:hydrogen peroxide-inducible genes activator [Legionella sp. W05-934-2]|jgi:LysR family hydrogen peroxide-inducible transcriptional activator|uniref:hydrogen peroxide-inducible genes activator n=1 Tax=Legionella sp. W05-934-2 TaxID=1198649 RepID=UPI0034629EF7
MKKLPPLRQLQYLIALHDYQHFGRAADACFVSQSTLSAGISQLEAMLDAMLIERQHKQFRFTALGEAVVSMSVEIVKQTSSLVDYINEQNKPMHGDLILGSIPTITPFIISEIMTACQKLFPCLNLYVKEMTTEKGLASLEKGDLDCLLLALPYDTSDFHCHHLCDDPFYLVVPAQDSPDFYHHSMNLWPDQSVLLLEDEHCLSQHAVQACTIRDKRLIHPFKAASLHTLTEMVAHGMGVTFVPKLAIESGILVNQPVKLIPQKGKKPYRELALLWRNGAGREKTCMALAKIMQNEIMKKLKIP